MHQGEFVHSKTNFLRIRPGFYKAMSAYRKTPQSALTGCQLSFALSSCTPFYEWLHLLNLSGEVKLGSPVGELAARKG